MHTFDAHFGNPQELPDSTNENNKENGLNRQVQDSLTREITGKASALTHRLETSDPNASKKLSAMDAGINWTRDSQGNFVTKNRWGKLLTRDDQGRMVDYKHFVETKRMGARDQMAFTSVLFCNPLMLLGLGATFAFMDNFRNSEKEYERLQNNLDGKKTGKELKGYTEKDAVKALVFINDRRPLHENAIAAGNAALKEKDARRRKRQLSLEDYRRRQLQALSVPDRSMLSKQNIAKMKNRLEEQLERMRGNADLKDIAQIETQIEKLDRALKRFSALSH